jgi:hypothetical protein
MPHVKIGVEALEEMQNQRLMKLFRDAGWASSDFDASVLQMMAANARRQH